MPQIFDNIEKHLLVALSAALGLSERADFCVGYFNLRGWRQVDCLVERWPGGDGHCCRLLVGMQQMPQDQLRSAMSLLQVEDEIDQATAIVLKRKLAQDFRDQLTIGIPTNEDEAGLRRLAAQITAGKLVVKLLSAASPPRQAVSALPPRPAEPNHRLPGQQQPDVRRPVEAGRTQHRRARPRCLRQARQVV